MSLPSIHAQLPSSVQLVPIYDRSQTIVNSVKDVQATLYIAFVLVVMVIFLFLGRATDTLIPAVALPLSLLLTFMVMKMLGYSLDNLSLMALTLAIGFLVDDAIVFLENTVRLMEDGHAALEATLESAKEISFTILAMTHFAGRRLHSAGVHDRADRAHLPRIFHHHHRLDFRQRHRFADAHAADVLAPAGPRGKGAKKTWMERVIGGIEHRVLNVYGRSLWFFLRNRWISAITWVICLAGNGVLLLHRPQSVSAGRRQLVHPRRDGRAGRLFARRRCTPIRPRRRRSCRRIPPWTARSP